MVREQGWEERAQSAEAVAGLIPHAARVFVHGAAATPTPLLEAMVRRRDLEGVRLYHLHLMGPAPFAAPEHRSRFRSVSLFTGANLRGAVADGDADFIPVFLSDIPGLFRDGQLPLDVALLQVSPPDRHGLCTLGTSVDTARAASESARLVFAEINRQMPRTHGATAIPFERIAAFTLADRPLLSMQPAEIGTVEAEIGERVARLVPHGGCLQMGIGAIPDAVLARLGDKLELGIHTEMFSDGVLPLLEAGVITNRKKTIHPGRSVTSFVMGSRALYDFVDDNPGVEFHPCDRTNDTAMLAKNDAVVAINSAIEVDLSGQVCADSIGLRVYSGIGGQMDFIRGAARSRGGVPIIALPSMAGSQGCSRIVPTLKTGAGVVTTRGHVHWVVTEYGAVNLHGLTLRERAEALISVAHPDVRAELCAAVAELRHYIIGNPGGTRV